MHCNQLNLASLGRPHANRTCSNLPRSRAKNKPSLKCPHVARDPRLCSASKYAWQSLGPLQVLIPHCRRRHFGKIWISYFLTDVSADRLRSLQTTFRVFPEHASVLLHPLAGTATIWRASFCSETRSAPNKHSSISPVAFSTQYSTHFVCWPPTLPSPPVCVKMDTHVL